jgi:hypothetical protein
MKCPVCEVNSEHESSARCTYCGCPANSTAEEVDRRRHALELKVARGGRLTCLRCDSKLKFYGTRYFHEGEGHPSFWFGNLGELAVNRVVLDAYGCQVCGKAEFFIDGVGEHLRNE